MSPTVGLDGSSFVLATDAREKRDMMMAHVPNAFIQTELNCDEGEEKIVMKITGVLVDLLIEESPLKCKPHAVCENGRKVSCVEVLQAMCGMLVSASLFCPQFKEDSEGIGFEFNLHEPCVSN